MSDEKKTPAELAEQIFPKAVFYTRIDREKANEFVDVILSLDNYEETWTRRQIFEALMDRAGRLSPKTVEKLVTDPEQAKQIEELQKQVDEHRRAATDLQVKNAELIQQLEEQKEAVEAVREIQEVYELAKTNKQASNIKHFLVTLVYTVASSTNDFKVPISFKNKYGGK